MPQRSVRQRQVQTSCISVDIQDTSAVRRRDRSTLPTMRPSVPARTARRSASLLTVTRSSPTSSSATSRLAFRSPAGDHLIEIKPTATGTTAISGTITLAAGGSYTAMAIGDGDNQPLGLKLLDDSTAAPAAGNGKLRVGHLAPFAADLDDTKVDICIDGVTSPVAPQLQDVPYNAVTDFLELPAGDYDLVVTIAGSNCGTVALDIPPVRLGNGEIADAYAIGKNDATFPLSISTALGINVLATVNIAHYAPFGTSQDGTSVSIFVDGDEALTDVKFGDVQTGVPLAAGDHLIEIKPTATGTTAISGTITLAAGGSYTAMAIGDGDNQPLGLKLLDDSTAAPAAGNGKLRVGHLAPFAADLDDTKVDICIDGDTSPVPQLQDVPYNAVADFLELPAGDYDLVVTIAGSNCGTVALDIPPVRLGNGEIADAYAIGKNDATFPLSISTALGINVTRPRSTLPTTHPSAPARTVPRSASLLTETRPSPTSSSATSRLAFRSRLATISSRSSRPPPAQRQSAARSRWLQGVPTPPWPLATAITSPWVSKLLDDSTAAPAAGNGKLRVGHLAPFAANLDDTKVDICIDGATSPVAPQLQGVPYNAVTDFLELPAGDYDLVVTIAGSNCGSVALDIPPVRLGNGEIADAYAIGKNDATFPLSISTALGINVLATVNIAHYAPFGTSQDGTSVSIFVDGDEALTNVKFGDVQTGVPLAAGDHLIEIKPTATGTTAISGTITLAAGGSYTAMAIGDGDNQPLGLKLLDDSTAAPAAGMAAAAALDEGNGKLRVGHLAPFSSDIEATKVDICFDDGTPIPQLQDVPYGAVTGFLDLPAGTYDLIITIAGSNCETVALDLAVFQVKSGEAADAYAIGKNNETFPLQLGTVTGLTTAYSLYMPSILK